ncbi:hypothetical protein DPEC_G00096850 [Dallia pectoralis]|uniref:Uncharacterized protein n=1 Tax=Dallia pectoralis TaxID=75939 RepID=A0ACC2GVK7_DALPE|nr:hypothetical protein DPEC_G00096850 [Dallia pectoralis]
MLALCLVLVLLIKACHPVSLRYARLGEHLTLKCTNPDSIETSWLYLLLLCCLGTALGLCVILITVLTCVLYKINTSNGRHHQPSGPAVSSHNQAVVVDTLHYAALNVDQKKCMVHKERNATDRDTVYSKTGTETD